MSFRISGEINDPVLFKKIMDAGVPKGGLVFYRQDDKGNIIDVAYFSATKRVFYTGEIDQKLADSIRNDGFKVASFQLIEDVLEISQK